MLSYLAQRGLLVHALSAHKYRHKKLPRGIISKSPFLPGVIRVENLKRLGGIYFLVIHANIVGYSLAVIVVVQTVHLLKMRVGYLLYILGYLYLRCDNSVLLDSGFTDTFRYFYPDMKDIYSWWSYRFRAREKNAGWRIDYFITSKRLDGRLAGAKIHTGILGSDHCPVELDLKSEG